MPGTMTNPNGSQNATRLMAVVAAWTNVAKAAVLFATGAGYLAVFLPLHSVMASSAGLLAAVPVVAAGWLYGFRGGLIAGLLAFLATAIIVIVATETVWRQWLSQRGTLSIAGLVLVVEVTGRLRDLDEQARRVRAVLNTRLEGRTRAEEALQTSDAATTWT